MKLGYLITSSLLSMTATSAHALTSKDLVGCWRVQSLVVDPNGTKSEPLSTTPAGRLIFTDNGQMSFLVMKPDLPSEWQMTGDRIATTLVAYFGTYELKGQELSIKAEGSIRPDWRGQTLKRIVERVSKTELVIDTPPGNVPVRVTAKPC
jgi:hypothetical protein